MKRFGRYTDDMNALYDAYNSCSHNKGKYNPVINTLILERAPGPGTYPGLKYVKIFLQKPGRGASLIHLGNVTEVLSDDGQGNMIITATDHDDPDKILNISIGKVSTSINSLVKVIDKTGRIENEFVTTIKPTYSDSKHELTIINIEEL